MSSTNAGAYTNHHIPAKHSQRTKTRWWNQESPNRFSQVVVKISQPNCKVGNTKSPSLRRAGMAQSRRMQCLICCHSISQEPICPKVESSLRTPFCLYKMVAALGKNLMDPMQNRFSQDWKAPLHAPDSLRATRHGWSKKLLEFCHVLPLHAPLGALPPHQPDVTGGGLKELKICAQIKAARPEEMNWTGARSSAFREESPCISAGQASQSVKLTVCIYVPKCPWRLEHRRTMKHIEA